MLQALLILIKKWEDKKYLLKKEDNGVRSVVSKY